MHKQANGERSFGTSPVLINEFGGYAAMSTRY
jgi:hypothetical protein